MPTHTFKKEENYMNKIDNTKNNDNSHNYTILAN